MELKDYLETAGISQREFARAIGVKASTVHYWVQGKTIPRPDQMKRIYRETKGAVRPEDFYSGENYGLWVKKL